jgi:serine/threonine-protein kinase
VSLSPGRRLGAYEVLALIGAGGMGEVYRARDTKLNRDVAIKLLPDLFASDSDRLARFQREAHVLASLNHPHIAAIYGLEEDHAAPAVLVMELVEGEELAQRIARGALPLDEALPLARQIAEALEAAHDAGIIHRDLKPANIKVRPDGNVKILDFGLAKAVEAAGDASIGGSRNLSVSPTLTTPAQMTGLGVVLGTAAYMSPEQAKGRPVDKRADVWAFGAVLYEMLTARRCFEGDDVSDTLASILRATPDWSALPPDTPPAIKRLLRRCLDKDVRSRLSDMAMVRLELRDADTEPRDAPAAAIVTAPKPSRLRTIAPYGAAALAALIAGAAVWRLRQPADVPQPVTRFSIVLPDQIRMTPSARTPLAISPDGTRLVYAANERLYIRATDQLGAMEVAGTAASSAPFVNSPFFSPDGQWLGFWHQGQLRKVAVGGGATVTICEAGIPPVGVEWAPDGRILWGAGPAGILAVPANGGTAAPLVSIQSGERAISPQLLPGGEWLLFVLFPPGASADQGQIVVQSRTGSERRVIVQGVRDARYAESGHLIYLRGNALLAEAFDRKRLAVSGGPVPVVDGVANASSASPAGFFVVSSTGTLFYQPGTGSGGTTSKLVQLARDGTRAPLGDVAGMSWFPRFSPDGSRIAFGVSASGEVGDPSDLWVLDVKRGARTRVTFTANNRFYPIWTRDGTRLTHADASTATNRVVQTAADGSGTAETLIELGPRSFPSSWSPDGRVLALYTTGPTGTRDLVILPMDATPRKPTPLVATPFEERGAIFSPDGRWIAYVSNKSGQNDIYARPYPGPGTEITISVGGGQEPVWAPSGKELFYRHGGSLFAVRVDATASSLTVGTPTRLFEDPYRLDTGGAAGGMANYDIAPDGRHFVMIEEPKSTSAATQATLNVVVNWFEELKRRAPAK